jgi:predicted NUDIX family NTP pyrophosphohydrolase
MAKKQSAGLLLYRTGCGTLEVFLVHPGGPFWAKKDNGAWSIPKGEFEEGEDALETARREFTEETGFSIDGRFVPLKPIRQPSGKIVSAWAIEGEADAVMLRSNTFRMEWPPKSGQEQEFPEVDRGGWFDVAEARRKLAPGQVPFVDELAEMIESTSSALHPGPASRGSLIR